jgi:hypothetical protein
MVTHSLTHSTGLLEGAGRGHRHGHSLTLSLTLRDYFEGAGRGHRHGPGQAGRGKPQAAGGAAAVRRRGRVRVREVVRAGVPSAGGSAPVNSKDPIEIPVEFFF